MDRDSHTSYSRVSLRMTSSHLAKYSMTWGIVRLLRDSWTSCTKHKSYISHVHEKTIQRDIDNIIVDVFKITCCSEPTDSFMVNVTVAQLPGHSRGTTFYSRLPPPWRRRCLDPQSQKPSYAPDSTVETCCCREITRRCTCSMHLEFFGSLVGWIDRLIAAVKRKKQCKTRLNRLRLSSNLSRKVNCFFMYHMHYCR